MACRCSVFFLLIVSITTTSGADAPLRFTANDRVLILAPHPDDEVLGAGGILQQALAAKASVHVVFLTMGDNYEWAFMAYRRRPVLKPSDMRQMGEMRRLEAIAAAKELGLAPDHLTFLGYPDWGTLAIWTSHWGEAPPLRSMLTRVTAVPYLEALRPGALYRGQDIVRDLETVLREIQPTHIFVSHPADAHRDHRSLYLFTKVALWNLDLRPALHPFVIHYKNWPRPWGFFPRQELQPPAAIMDEGRWLSVPLTSSEQAVKAKALAAHKTQFQIDHRFLSSFLRPNEVFDDVPDIVLKRDQTSNDLSAGAQRPAKMAAPQELSPEAQDDFIGIDWRTLERQGENLIVTLNLSRALVGNASASLYVFGWRKDHAFSAMPKLQIRIGLLGIGVYDQEKKFPTQSVRVTHDRTSWQFRIPLSVLGNPQALLTGARTSLGKEPKNRVGQPLTLGTLDWTSWRTVLLPE